MSRLRPSPELAEAVRKTLDARGDFATGWSMAWKINFHARLQNGERAHRLLGNLFQRNILPNLFDTLSPVPLFSGLRTTSDVSSLASNPTLSAINTLLSMKKIVANAASSESQTTEADVKQWLKLAPLNTTVGISNIYNMLASDFPQNAKE